MAKETSVIGDDIQIFNYLRGQGLHKRQKKLRLSLSLYRVLILCADRVCKKAKETSVIGDDIQIFNYLRRRD